LRCAESRVQGAGSHHGVDINAPAAGFVQLLQQLYDGRVVSELDHVERGGLRLVNIDSLVESDRSKVLTDGDDSLRPLGMSGARIVS
jgi:hypothetical protein